MIRKLYILFIVSIISFSIKGQSITYITSIYEESFNNLYQMIETDSLYSFKDAVYHTENAFFEGMLPQEEFNYHIDRLVFLANQIIQNSELLYDFEDKEIVEKYAAVFKLMTDSIPIIVDTTLYYHIPYTYDFEDFNGNQDWTNMFVTKLIETHTGNCHSLPFLYKIVVEELGVPAHLALAPNHTYIKLFSKNGGWYNTELTNATFPIDAWLMASGYIHLDAIRNGLYMDTLSKDQSIAMCITDLAKGYQRKVGTFDGEFILKCCDTALTYFPNYINALLLKAETQKEIFAYQMEKLGFEYPSELFAIEKYKMQFEEMEQTYVYIHELGYRKMPDEMYINWLVSLKNEKEKYLNKKVINTFAEPKPNKK